MPVALYQATALTFGGSGRGKVNCIVSVLKKAGIVMIATCGEAKEKPSFPCTTWFVYANVTNEAAEKYKLSKTESTAATVQKEHIDGVFRMSTICMTILCCNVWFADN